MENEQSTKKVVMWKRVVIPIAALIAFYTIFGFVIIPVIGKSVLQKTLSENLGRETTIENIDLNPYALALTLEGLTIKEPDKSETFISLGKLYLDFQVISPFKRALVAREIRIEKPYINIARHGEDRFNFSDLMGEEKKDEDEKKEEPAPLPRFSLNNIQLVDGAVHIWDGVREKEHNIDDINIGIPLISDLPYHIEIFVQPQFAANFNKTSVALKGQTKPFADSRQTVLDIDLEGINIPYYLAYVPVKLDFKMLSGYLDIKGALTYVQKPEGDASFSVAGNVAMKSLEIVDSESRPVLKLPLLDISIASLEPMAGKMHLSGILIESPEVNVTRDETGNLNLQTLIPTEEKETGPRAPESEDKGRPFDITVDETKVAEGKVTFSDLSANQPFETIMNPLNLTVKGFSNEEGTRAPFDFSLVTETNESVELKGEFSVKPLAAQSTLNIQDISLAKYGSYIPDDIQIIVKDGKFSSKGDLSLSSSEEGDVTTTYHGEIVLSDLSCVDKSDHEDLVKWTSLRFDKTDVGINPTYVNIGEISLSDLFVSVIVNAEKKLNLQNILADEGEEKPEPVDKGPSTAEDEGKADGSVNIGKVSLKGGQITFLDKSIKPSYSAKLTDIEASVTGLTSKETKGADVLLKGKLDKHAPLEIKGKIDPLEEDLYVDLKVALKNVELSPLTPYSGRYVGYTIGKGELSLDLGYLIDKNDLKSQNRFFIDQLTFGKKVDSPDATSLPVTLGVALLKNRNGEIDLDIPVSGSLDDPKFKVGKVIWKTIMNLLVKAATSPFSLLGAIVGGGEELSVVEFDYGRFVITPESEKKLDSLVTALYDRPSLKLDIEGHVDMEKDREGLRQYLFEKKLKAQKLEALTKKGTPAISVDEVNIEADEYEGYLKKAYKEEKFDKPRNFLGLAKKLPAAEMESLMLEHIAVEDDDLRLLAVERARAVEARLLETGKIEPQRIFLVEPKSLVPEKKEGLKDSRVDLKLK